MTVEKSALKALIAEGFASDFVETKDKTNRAIHRHRGAAEAFRRVEVLLREMSQAVNKVFLDGELPYDPEDKFAVGKYVVGVLMQCSGKVRDLAENASLSSIRAEGELLAVERAIEQLASAAQRERQRVETAERLAKENPGFTTVPGSEAMRDGPLAGLPLKMQKLIEEVAEKNAAASGGQPKATAEKAKPKRKRSVKPKAKAKKKSTKKVRDAKDS